MKIIVCGVGNVAFRVIELLEKVNESVTVIALSGDELFVKSIRSRCERFIEGDARDPDVLADAGIPGADVLMALTGDDVVNLDISLHARDLSATIRIITRMSDDLFSRKIQTGFGIDRVLSPPYLSAHSFVSACLDETVQHAFQFENTMYYIAEHRVEASSPFAGMDRCSAEKKFSSKIIVHERRNPEKAGDSDILGEGDIVLISTFSKKVVEKLNPNKNGTRVKRERSGTGVGRALLEKMRNIPYNVRLIAILYFVLISVSVMIFNRFVNLSIIDSLYFVITTTTTVGYGDFNLQNASPALKIFGSLVMLCGAALLASIFSVITDSLISRRFNQFFGIGKSRMRNHVVIAGLGNIGYRVINLLYESGEKIIAIECNPECEFLPSLRGRIPVIFGNALHPDTMKIAGIKNAKAIMALTDDDLVNINTVLNALETNRSIRSVGRIFNRIIMDKADKAFAISSVLSTSAISAPMFVSVAANKHAEYAFMWRGSLWVLIEVEIDQYDFLAGLSDDEFVSRFNLHPCLYRSGDGASGHCRDNYRAQKGDAVLLAGRYEDVKKFPAN